ncbi:YbaB/EbfC family nucleoid-associated protein [Nocardioides insulae]|uniref:YbaB/EbfC family nucleoid-associated protein n=1 Tax=Nocardioides insulae TaxID=394734 RepID=UPI00040AF1B6|nr:YbaB/EbfC family nucleoid-associated protein [Nocardioides insulae]
MADELITDFTPENLPRIMEQHQRRAEEAMQAANELREIRGTGRSDRGLVTATVDGSGLLVDVVYAQGAPSAYAMLGAALKQAHDRALADWQRQVTSITEEKLGHQPDLQRTIRAQSEADLAAHIDPDNLRDDPETPRR